MAVSAAFAFAGPMKGGSDEALWRTRLQDGVLRASAAMNGRLAQIAQDVLDCDVFKAVYRSYVLEETSMRLIVTLESETANKADQDADGLETIRTERTDNALGRAMQRRLDALPEGSTILAFKLIEHMEGRGTKDKVRILKHFEVLNVPSKDSTSSGNPPPAPSRAPAGNATPAGATATEGPSTSVAENADPFDKVSIGSRMAALPGPKAAMVARRARAAGVANFIQPANDDETATVMKIIDEVEAE